MIINLDPNITYDGWHICTEGSFCLGDECIVIILIAHAHFLVSTHKQHGVVWTMSMNLKTGCIGCLSIIVVVKYLYTYCRTHSENLLYISILNTILSIAHT